MLRVIVSRGPQPIGTKGWQQQVIGVFCHDAPGQEAAFPVPVPVLLPEGDKGFAPGEYRMNAASFAPKADSYGKLVLTLGRVVLDPVKK